MKLSKVLIDTNVCLDTVLKSNPFAANALEITERSELGDFTGLIAAHSFDTLFFILNKYMGKTKVYQAIKSLRKAFKVAPVSRKIIDDALDAGWEDYEDAIHYYAARKAGCQAIVTRNDTDYRQSELAVLSPVEFLNEIKR